MHHDHSTTGTLTGTFSKQDFNSSQSNKGVQSSSSNPCPLCNGEDWCFHLSEDAVVCGRVDQAPSGWIKTSEAKDGRSIFAKKGNRKRRQQTSFPDPETLFPLPLNPKTDSPQWVTLSTVGTESEQQIEYFYPDPKTGEPLGKVVRKQWTDRRAAYKGKTKEPRPWHWAEPAHPDMGGGWWSDRGKGGKSWPLYREAEVKEEISSGHKTVFLLGGEQDVETAREIGLVAFCNQGGEGSYTKRILAFLEESRPSLLCIPHDNDEAGRKFAQKIVAGCQKLHIAAIALDLREICPDLKEKGDITNIIKDQGMDKFEFIQLLEESIHRVLSLEEAKRQGLDLDHASSTDDSVVGDPNWVNNRTVEKVVLDNVFKREWVTMDDTYYRYSGHGHWSKAPDKTVLKLISEQCELAYDLIEKEGSVIQKFRYATDSKKQSAFKFARDRLHQEVSTTNRNLRAFSNCTVDLRTGEALPHNPAHFLTTAVAANYEPNQECPEVFLNFIKAAYGEDLIDMIRACTSMLLDPTAPYGKFIHLIGPAGSGKGTLLRLWGELFGLEHHRSGDFQNLNTAEGRHQYLSGCSLFAVPDTGGYQQGLRAFYELVDNGAMSGRALFSSNGYQKRWDIRFVIASVKPLHIENSGDGWERRCIPLPTKQRTGIADPTLEAKLAESKGQVISWALAMPREERDRLLLHPSTNQRILDLQHDTAITGDPVRAFIELCSRPSEKATEIQNHELHDKFNAFAQAHGYQSWGMSKLISHLKNLLPNHHVARRKYKGVMVPAHWVNIEFLGGVFIDQSEGSSTPNYKCIKSMCREGGLTEFAEFGSGRSTGSGCGSGYGSTTPDPVQITSEQGLSENGSGGSGGEGVTLQTFDQNFLKQNSEIKNLNLDHHPTPPTPDPADLPDPQAETIENSLPTADQGADQGANNLEVPDPIKVGDKVWWDNCPAHSQMFNPFFVTAIRGDKVMLDIYSAIYSSPVSINELRKYQLEQG